MPESNGSYSAAVAIMYRGVGGTPKVITFTPEQIGLNYTGGYNVYEVFKNDPLGSILPPQSMVVQVNPNGKKK